MTKITAENLKNMLTSFKLTEERETATIASQFKTTKLNKTEKYKSRVSTTINNLNKFEPSSRNEFKSKLETSKTIHRDTEHSISAIKIKSKKLNTRQKVQNVEPSATKRFRSISPPKVAIKNIKLAKTNTDTLKSQSTDPSAEIAFLVEDKIVDNQYFNKPVIFDATTKCSDFTQWRPKFNTKAQTETSKLSFETFVEGTVLKIPIFDNSLFNEEELLASTASSSDINKKEHVIEESPKSELDIDNSMEQENSDTDGGDSIGSNGDLLTEANEPVEIFELDDYVGIFENSVKTNSVLAVIKTTIEFYGTVTAKLLSGQIDCNGYKARKNESFTIYSPKGFPWVTITPTTIKKQIAPDLNCDEELAKSFSQTQLDNIATNFEGNGDAIILFQRNSRAKKLINHFRKHMAENLFPSINILPTNRPLYQSEFLLHCLIQSSQSTSGVVVPKKWTKIDIEKSSKVMICGGKSVGKSTLLRYLFNRHLYKYPRILLIDLDIGQPELFVPETISCTVLDAPLLGPGFFQKKQPDRAYAVGHVNVVMCAEQYCRAVKQLLDWCHKNTEFADLPWFINTMGYNKGFGLELMSLMVNYIKPTDVIQIRSHKEINNFDKPLEWKVLSNIKRIIYTSDEFNIGVFPEYSLIQIPSATPELDRSNKAGTMSAKDLRYVNFLARLSAALQDNADWLTECQPVCVPLNLLNIRHLTNSNLSREEVIAGMEANIVFLCRHRPGVSELLSECLGIGVIRAIDYSAEKLYLVPAMPLGRLAHVDCLVIGGDLTLPQSFFKDQGPRLTSKVPFVFIVDDSKCSKSIRQVYFRTPQFRGYAKKIQR